MKFLLLIKNIQMKISYIKSFTLFSFFIFPFSIIHAQVPDTVNKMTVSPVQGEQNVNNLQEQRNGEPVISNDQAPVNNGQAPIDGANIPLHSPQPGTTDSTSVPLNSNQTAPNGKLPAPHKK